jgi:hypothetical protein
MQRKPSILSILLDTARRAISNGLGKNAASTSSRTSSSTSSATSTTSPAPAFPHPTSSTSNTASSSTPLAELTERQQRAAERILEDERLTRDLTDDQARPLVEWASTQAALVAADTTCSETELDDRIAAIRRAVVHVGRTAAGEHDAARLVALAQESLEKGE